ncbi:MAG: PqqD family protein [Atopobiaceae bacterium]|nr:PqqD family protein [Atopobiaceae bacterium]
MKLKEEYITHEIGDGLVLVPTGSASWSGFVRGNKTFGAILSLLREDTTEEAIVAAMRERFDAPEGAIERDVARAISELRKVGALDG